MGGGVTIRLEVYLPYRGRSIWRGQERLPAGISVVELPAMLGLTEPELAVLINGRQVAPHTLVADGDEVAVLRQSEGGD